MMILDWDREDDPAPREIRRMALIKSQAEADVHGRITIETMSTGGEGAQVTLLIENTGRSGFFIESIDWHAEWLPPFREQGLRGELPPDYVAPGASLRSPRSGLLPPGEKFRFHFNWSRGEALEHFRSVALTVEGFIGSWAAYHFAVHCRTDLGGAGVLRCTARQ